MGFRDVLDNEGRPPYRSPDMLKLYLYGYKNKLRSSRQLEHACKMNLKFPLGHFLSQKRSRLFDQANVCRFEDRALVFVFQIILVRDDLSGQQLIRLAL